MANTSPTAIRRSNSVIEQIVNGELVAPDFGPNHLFITYLRRWMVAKNMEPRDVARGLSCSYRTVIRYLSGESCPSEEVLDKIARLFGVDPKLLKRVTVRPRKGRPSKWSPLNERI